MKDTIIELRNQHKILLTLIIVGVVALISVVGVMANNQISHGCQKTTLGMSCGIVSQHD